MGCISSSPSSPPPSTLPTPPSARPTSPAPQYDTQTAASLADSSLAPVPFHGLLNTSDAISLIRRDNSSSKLLHHSTNTFQNCSVYTGTVMTMPFTIVVAQQGADDRVARLASSVFQQAHLTFNAWNQSSEISTLNRAKPGKNIPMSPHLADLFRIVDQIHTLSQGRFDPTTGVLTTIFQNCISDKKRPPLPAELAPFKFAIGWSKRVQRNDTSVSRGNAHTVIDLDGLSKGHIIDLIVNALLADGFQDCYVDWAGDIRAVGSHPSGRQWTAALMSPPPLKTLFEHWKNNTMNDMLSENDIRFLVALSTSAGAVATSGDYFAMQKYGYHHIARPDQLTVMKANAMSVASVCVVANTCAIADGLATAAMTFGTMRDTVAFLDTLIKTHPDLISGYCVMGRAQGDGSMPIKVVGDVFKAVTGKEANVDHVAEDHDTGAEQAALSELQCGVILENIVQKYGSVQFNGRTVEVNSIVACSMEPEQLVTFVVPDDFLKNASLNREHALNKVSGNLYTDAARKQSIKIDMSVRHIYATRGAAIVVASIEKIELGNAERCEVTFRGTIISEESVELGIGRSKFGFQPLIDQTKSMFRQFGSMVWLVRTESVDGSDIGLTATSVVVSNVTNSLVCLNITHSSRFFASFGGVGSTVKMYALSRELQKVAELHVREGEVSKGRGIEEGSIVQLEGVVEIVEDVQDHVIIGARICKLRVGDEALKPLVWRSGTFLNYYK